MFREQLIARPYLAYNLSFAFKEVVLTRKYIGAEAVDVEILNALLVGVMRVDRCLTKEEK